MNVFGDLPGYKAVEVDARTFDSLSDHKRSTDSWSDFLGRLLTAVHEDQVHMNRSTLEDFDLGDESADTVRLRASEQGVLTCVFVDDSGNEVGRTSPGTLSSETEITLEITTGEIVD